MKKRIRCDNADDVYNGSNQIPSCAVCSELWMWLRDGVREGKKSVCS